MIPEISDQGTGQVADRKRSFGSTVVAKMPLLMIAARNNGDTVGRKNQEKKSLGPPDAVGPLTKSGAPAQPLAAEDATGKH